MNFYAVPLVLLYGSERRLCARRWGNNLFGAEIQNDSNLHSRANYCPAMDVW